MFVLELYVLFYNDFQNKYTLNWDNDEGRCRSLYLNVNVL